jgi:hypothetical protein
MRLHVNKIPLWRYVFLNPIRSCFQGNARGLSEGVCYKFLGGIDGTHTLFVAKDEVMGVAKRVGAVVFGYVG